MIRLLFNLNQRTFQFTVKNYKIINDFYEFTDIKDHKFRRLHKSLYLGEEEVGP